VSTPTATSYTGTFSGRAQECARVRREIIAYLAGCPATDEIVLIASELAANCITHTRSRNATFGIGCELSPRSARIEARDMGGPWEPAPSDDRPHGLAIIGALTGPGGWGTGIADDGGRITWARLTW